MSAPGMAPTRKLLAHYDIHTSLSNLTHVERLLEQGKHVVLVSDAGTPGLSDPGLEIVSRLRELGITIEAIPGASALTASLSIAGVNAREFTFLGFLPHKKGRQTALKKIAATQSDSSQGDFPTVLYESPHRILKLLKELEVRCGSGVVLRIYPVLDWFAVLSDYAEWKVDLLQPKVNCFAFFLGQGVVVLAFDLRHLASVTERDLVRFFRKVEFTIPQVRNVDPSKPCDLRPTRGIHAPPRIADHQLVAGHGEAVGTGNRNSILVRAEEIKHSVSPKQVGIASRFLAKPSDSQELVSSF